ncbi:MAG: hypothetical protein PHC64_10560, partial [Candidatus Gastranaerophilales bacterium]|nr:hypothetical protein [Candidatus Gastranaerophilales bacterium]
ARFINSETIGREQPFVYFIPIFLLGFMPWTFTFLAFIADGCKKLSDKFKSIQGTTGKKIMSLIEVTTNEQKLILFASIYFTLIFLIFSISSTKLPTYILPVFPAAALLTGYFWWVSDEKGEHEKSIYNSTLIFAAMFIFAALTASVSYYFLPYEIQDKIADFKQVTILTLYVLSILLILRLYTKRALSVFSGYIFTMIFVIALSVSQIFNLIYTGGENEIVEYSITSIRPDYTSQLVTFDFAVKPSVMMQYEDKVNFITDDNFTQLDKSLKYNGGPTFVIIKNKNFNKNTNYKKELEKRLELLKKGEKYSLYVKDVNNEYNKLKNGVIEFNHFSSK